MTGSAGQDHSFGDRELDILQVLWRHGESTVGEVQESLAAGGAQVAYTTVQTMLNRLEAKGVVGRRSADRAHRYYALAEQPAVLGSAIGRLTDRFFKGSAEQLATHLVEKGLDADQLERLRALIDRHRATRRR